MNTDEKKSFPLEESKTPTEQDLSSPLKQIRTFQGDVANALKSQNESIVSIQRAEVKKNIERKQTRILTPEEKARNRSRYSAIFLFFGIFILIGLGLGGSWLAYKEYKVKMMTPEIVSVPNMFFHADTLLHNNVIGVTREPLVRAIERERMREGGPLVEQFQLHVGEGVDAPLLTTSAFLSLLQSQAPASLIRSLNPLFMLGTIKSNRKHTYLLIKLDSYENAFPGMLSWEANLPKDLLPLFATASTTENISPEARFSDTTIQNRDARILKDAVGQTILLYSFFDNKILIITDTEETFKSIITRLISEKLIR